MRRLAGELVGDAPSAAEAPIPAGYAESALDLIESGRANFNVGQDLLADWAEAPTLFDDPGWRRNIVAQADTWDALVELADGLRRARVGPRDARRAVRLAQINSGIGFVTPRGGGVVRRRRG